MTAPGDDEVYAINESAPVKASASVLIEAPFEQVWRLLTDINGWPGWHAAVTTVRFRGDVAEGASFEWNDRQRGAATARLPG